MNQTDEEIKKEWNKYTFENLPSVSQHLGWWLAKIHAMKEEQNKIKEDTILMEIDYFKGKIIEIIKESGHQQEDDTIWCDMDELLKKIDLL